MRNARMEAEELLRIAAAPINSGYAVGCFVIVGSSELTDLAEVQLFAGADTDKFMQELSSHLASGRAALAACPMFDMGWGQWHFDIQVAPRFRADERVQARVRRAVGRFLGMPSRRDW